MIMPMLFRAHAKEHQDAMTLAMSKFYDWMQIVELQPTELSGYSTQTIQGLFDGVLLWLHTISFVVITDRDIDWSNSRKESSERWKEIQEEARFKEIVWQQPQEEVAYISRPAPTGKRDEEALRYLVKAQNARALKMGAAGTFTYEEWMLLCEHFEDKCVSCGQPNDRLCMDHVVPLSRGGTNFIENLQPLCRPCNSGKRAKSTDYRGELAYSFLEKLEELRKSSG